MITVSTHVLDSVTGKPAPGMVVSLESAVLLGPDAERSWVSLGSGATNTDGRLKSWADAPIGIGDHRLVFDTGTWFARQRRSCFYPEVIIAFTVDEDGSHYHVPLLLAPYAYSTYRGS